MARILYPLLFLGHGHTAFHKYIAPRDDHSHAFPADLALPYLSKEIQSDFRIVKYCTIIRTHF